MTTEQVGTPVISEEAKDEVNEYFAKLNEEANLAYKQELEYIMRNDEIKSSDGETYILVKVKPKTKIAFRQLQSEVKGVDVNSPEYYDNLCKRACLLIKDFTKERFEDCDVELVEKIVVAWSARAFNGFRPSIQRTT
jgi:hypothetical protein